MVRGGGGGGVCGCGFGGGEVVWGGRVVRGGGWCLGAV